MYFYAIELFFALKKKDKLCGTITILQSHQKKSLKIIHPKDILITEILIIS